MEKINLQIPKNKLHRRKRKVYISIRLSEIERFLHQNLLLNFHFNLFSLDIRLIGEEF
jgi:hypothetical protein